MQKINLAIDPKWVKRLKESLGQHLLDDRSQRVERPAHVLTLGADEDARGGRDQGATSTNASNRASDPASKSDSTTSQRPLVRCTSKRDVRGGTTVATSMNSTGSIRATSPSRFNADAQNWSVPALRRRRAANSLALSPLARHAPTNFARSARDRCVLGMRLHAERRLRRQERYSSNGYVVPQRDPPVLRSRKAAHRPRERSAHRAQASATNPNLQAASFRGEQPPPGGEVVGGSGAEAKGPLGTQAQITCGLGSPKAAACPAFGAHCACGTSGSPRAQAPDPPTTSPTS